MRYSLLDYIACSSCGGDLNCAFPVPENHTAANKNDSEEIKEGLLVCKSCGIWYPIIDYIPELLPPHLRDWEKDGVFLKKLEQKLSKDTYKDMLEKLQAYAGSSDKEDKGLHHKRSEMSIKDNVSDESFFGPGSSSPFNPCNPDYTMHLIRRLGNVLPLLELKQDDLVLDIGVGYAWTTEWLKKIGFQPIGVDICRTYVDIGVKRMGENLPYLVIGDIENLPLKDHILNAVLCYDAFHHIPNRQQAMGRFFRSLKENGNIVLAEPAGDHEFAQVSKDVMDKYGILEKGMDLEDVKDYCNGLRILPPEQHYILKIQGDEQGNTLLPEFIHTHSYMDCNVYVVKKRQGKGESVSQAVTLKSKVKQKIKRLLNKFLYKYLWRR
jgi:uncharacterized protein YbaR (Trm112 family)/2-polyprenyl-3-methyl-5-hydroxy-6-metoxy-1,4-benzoquinol methylase